MKITRKNGRKYTLKDNPNRFFFPTEYMKFEDCLKPKQKFSVIFLINTGARIDEASHVKVNDIDFINKRLVLRKVKRKVLNSYMVFGYKTVPRLHKDSCVLDVIQGVLGRGQSGRVFDEVRNKRGLAYEVGG